MKNPKPRELRVRRTDHDGTPALLLQDPTCISPNCAVIPLPLAPVIALLDGVRTIEEICREGEALTGITLDQETVRQLAVELDRALLLD